ncbi:antitoxin VbhA family protein [Pseudonocardia sp. TRM90224]|uniref:antitoxin VbhA family protein n=1 Tax=Pseudonocardia sp. TRM90224 TaxID=2812678 RepID=UPI001E48E2D3|nr:antitoxin VbhA family protein [Pseudonocardia sp. TRM90224]
MSASQYEKLDEAQRRQIAVREALASVRAEGLEPDADGLRLIEHVASGELTTDQAREQMLALYRQ